MRLIDADALESKGLKFETHGGATFIALGSVRTAPTIDAVPVVRCKDCKWRSLDCIEQDYYCTHAAGMYGFVSEDDFCSYGERKDGDG